MAIPVPTVGIFPGQQRSDVVAGQPAAPGADVNGSAASAVFNTIIGVTVAPDENTAYVLEGTWDVFGTAIPNNVVRKITNLRQPIASRAVSTFGTVPGLVSTGQIRVGPTTGRIYVSVQVGSNSGSMGTCEIGYFNPDGSWGGFIGMGAVPIIGGFTFTADEQTFFFTWIASSNPGNWNNLNVGRYDVGGSQNSSYVNIFDYYPPGFFGPPGQFVGAGGCWLDEPNGRLYFCGTGDFTKRVSVAVVLPSYSYFANNVFTDLGGDVAGVEGWRDPFGSPSLYLAVIGGGHGFGSMFLTIGWTGDVTGDFTGSDIRPTGVVEFVTGSGYSWDETGQGGFMGTGNHRLYYHDTGAVYSLYLYGSWMGALPLDGVVGY